MAYSKDIRQIVLTKVQVQKQSILSVAKLLGIARHTIEDWVKIAKGSKILSVRPSDRSHTRTKLIVDYVNLNPDKSLLEMEIELGISDTNIAYHLKKAGYSFKKNKKHTKKNVQLKDSNI